MRKASLTGIIVLMCVLGATAQDTSKRRTIDITSTFKPVLMEAAKVNFNAAPPIVDTTRPNLQYNIPAENLFFTYQPADLNPVAMETDSLGSWGYSNFIKVGIGNVHQPYIRAGFSFGDGNNTFFNIFAKHYTAKGDKPFQKNSQTAISAMATYKTPKNLEWSGGLGFRSDNNFLYGYQPDSLLFTKEQLKQQFQTIEGKVSLRNITPTSYGLTYNPSIHASVFSDNHDPKASEANTVLKLPLTKTFGKTTALDIGVTADLTNYRFDATGKKNTSNNVFLVSPAIQFKTPNLFLHAGLTPSWDNGSFYMLPDAMADITTNDKRFTLQLGWIGYYNKGSYRRYASINPWLAQPDSLLNTRVQEIYAGFKGSLANHFSYSAKIGMQQHHNMPLFVNDDIDGKTFVIRYEPKLNIFQTHAEAQYAVGEQFIAKASADWYRYSKLDRETKAWGLLPLELNASIRWQLIKDLWFNTELLAFDGAQYRGKAGESYKGETGFDLNAGVEFRVLKNFNLWVQMNNIFNNTYQRWHQYEVFGFNILGGITYTFDQ